MKLSYVPFVWVKRALECYMEDNPGLSRESALLLVIDLWKAMESRFESGMTEYQLMNVLKRDGVI